MNAWKDAEKDPPKHSRPVIIAVKSEGVLRTWWDTAFYEHENWYDFAHCVKHRPGLVKYWQDLPVPPDYRDTLSAKHRQETNHY